MFNFDTFPSTKPEFKKTKKPTKETEVDDDSDAFIRKIKYVDLYKYRDFDKEFYRQTISDTLELCEEEIIVPYVSQKFGLHEINNAIDYIKSKKCTGKVLIDIRQPKEKMDDDNDDDDDTKVKKEKSKTDKD